MEGKHHLLTLPAEIRTNILEHLLSEYEIQCRPYGTIALRHVVAVPVWQNLNQKPTTRNLSGPPPILFVCKQLSQEVLEFAHSHFPVRVDSKTDTPGECLAWLSTFHRNALRHLTINAYNHKSSYIAGYTPTPSIQQLSLVQSLPSLGTLTIHTDLGESRKTMGWHPDVESLKHPYVDRLVLEIDSTDNRASLEAMVQGWWTAFDSFEVDGEKFSCGGRVEVVLVYRMGRLLASITEQLSPRELLARVWNNLKSRTPLSQTVRRDLYDVPLHSHVLEVQARPVAGGGSAVDIIVSPAMQELIREIRAGKHRIWVYRPLHWH